jgi:CMP-N,N'-diacetyllegionaminic acid synthase
MKDVLAIIPARGGSKGIPKKNIVDFCGRPLVSWTIAAALESTRVTRVVVSTDSEDVATAAKTAGAEIPFMRGGEIAGDEVHAVYTVLDALERLQASEGYVPNVVLMLLPTTPLRQAWHVDDAVELLDGQPDATVVGVHRWNRYLTNLREVRDGRLTPVVQADDYNVQRQSQAPLFVVNGAMFAAPPAVLRRHRSFHIPGAIAYVMSEQASIDINDERDLARARAAMARAIAT